MVQPTMTEEPLLARRLAWGGFWLGFALGGFLDGIILHQILQWHHLLSQARPATLYRHGALLVSNGPVAVGCLSWTAM
jgi:uncharacterized membrane protein